MCVCVCAAVSAVVISVESVAKECMANKLTTEFASVASWRNSIAQTRNNVTQKYNCDTHTPTHTNIEVRTLLPLPQLMLKTSSDLPKKVLAEQLERERRSSQSKRKKEDWKISIRKEIPKNSEYCLESCSAYQQIPYKLPRRRLKGTKSSYLVQTR